LHGNSIYEESLQHVWDVFNDLISHIKEKIQKYRLTVKDPDEYTGLPYFPLNVLRGIGGGAKHSLNSLTTPQPKKKPKRVAIQNVSSVVSEKIGVYERKDIVKDENGLPVTIRLGYNMKDYFFDTIKPQQKRISPTLVTPANES
jgi:hypothetical protein